MNRDIDRRRFLSGLVAGSSVVALGGVFAVACDRKAEQARNEKRGDGRARLPPGQYLLERLRPMGGAEGDPSPRNFRLKVHGEVEHPFELGFAELLQMAQVEQTCDVHCVTKWTVLGARFKGVRLSDLAKRAGLKASARHVVFEAAEGYTSNVRIEEAMQPNVLLAHEHEGEALALPHGPPVRALVPDLYFWKSAKWLTGVYFSDIDRPGFWETRGYHNHADPWKEERTT
ncbi:MAG: molybdopterin-dependent oxidoreductase [Polyangiales bacterium]